MDEQSLALSFGDSLTEEVSGCVGEFVEIGIDSVLEDGLLKEIGMSKTLHIQLPMKGIAGLTGISEWMDCRSDYK